MIPTPVSVSTLPVLDQTQFPALPKLPEGVAMLVVIDSRLGSYEREAVLGILTTVAIRAGAWKPVSTFEFVTVAKQGIPPAKYGDVIEAVWKLFGEGIIGMVRFGEEDDYLVPTAAFAGALIGSQLRHLPIAA